MADQIKKISFLFLSLSHTYSLSLSQILSLSLSLSIYLSLCLPLLLTHTPSLSLPLSLSLSLSHCLFSIYYFCSISRFYSLLLSLFFLHTYTGQSALSSNRVGGQSYVLQSMGEDLYKLLYAEFNSATMRYVLT